MIRRRILHLCRSIEGAAREDVLRLFADSEGDAVLAEIATLVTDGVLVEREGRLYPGGAS